MDAAARWSEIIVGDLPDKAVANPATISDSCNNVPDNIDDVYICASITVIDGVGGVLGQAGPEVGRFGSTIQTLIGFMEFDVADVDALVAAGTFAGVIVSHIFALGLYYSAFRLV
jgi:hypothetical protein